ncbi:ATP-grasp ribosomal peptide maturase [Thermopolyspora flexuosa]|jgi:ATP-grasp ribosomal peptide maturase|uniref:ATP-grasp ribosomal peptide maturase n=1 Tax=Thermopolyspora flexuosa TaxID=103836 RepID=A0A543J4F9_9ACTN|nr:ATP-dependent carboxylate-amine ligase [Thermopolyspora flexuosa]TQM77702.1 ATP-grasp ribosomal peptide maturase [Thermopolyspora flexuosa]GGM71401.1 ATP-grasp ribosomal peptide maturase [Thermopolyspora flexuosa]
MPEINLARPRVLVLTQPDDVHADRVIGELRARGTSVARFDLADYPMAATLTATLTGDRPWRAALRHGETVVDLAEVRGVYYRRPRAFGLPDALKGLEREFALAETRRGIGGLLRSLPARWVSHPEKLTTAQYKPLQLTVARRRGLRVPDTLVTNDPDAARAFLRERDRVVYKSLSGRPVAKGARVPQVVMTTEITDEHAAHLDRVRVTPCLFQEYVKKDHEIRAVVVGREVFAAAVDSQASAHTAVDWRFDAPGLDWSACELPEPVARACVEVVADLGLAFGAVDLIVTPAGDHVFLEVNGNGQWLWLEEEAGLPIGAAIANLLAGEGP